ncbi:MAG: Grx4 family monothiol glutaredoxin [Rickettsiaceae bacterium]|nr:MAG: Grx4 family monothiol glutaredoxin [Rickettsiaceae bacterium]
MSVINMIDFIQDQIKNHDVVLFIKGTKQFPQCGFSAKVVSIMDHMAVTFKDINVLENEQLRQNIKDFSNWPTVPQVYICGEFIGGCDIITEMYHNGDLLTLLKNKNILAN